jgi:hypothetical protein
MQHANARQVIYEPLPFNCGNESLWAWHYLKHAGKLSQMLIADCHDTDFNDGFNDHAELLYS